MQTILLHGLGQTPASWDATHRAMEGPDICCPRLPDWLGSGSVCYSDLYRGLEKYCGQFEAPVNLCGLSLGGILAMQFAIEHPEKVNALALIGTQYVMPKRLLQFQNILFRFMPDFLFQEMGFGKKDFINLSKSMIDLDFQQDLSKIRCPVLVICGDKDRMNKPAALQLTERIPQAVSSMIANAGHEVNLDQPEALGKALKAFFYTNA